jgi:hypothetical protein
MGIGRKIKKAGKSLYHAATDPRVVIINPEPEVRTVYVERRTVTPQPAPAPRTVYIERHMPTPPPTRVVYVEPQPLGDRVVNKLEMIQNESYFTSYTHEYDSDTWNALKRFGRALTNLYYDGHCHRINVSVNVDELAVIRRMISNCRVPVIKDSHSAYRALAQVFLSKYFD